MTGFLDLPIEVRLQIYPRHASYKPRYDYQGCQFSAQAPFCYPSLAILHVSRRIHEEAQEALLRGSQDHPWTMIVYATRAG